MATWYADAAVSSGGTGAIGDPWPIATAMSSASINAGDTVNLRGNDSTRRTFSRSGSSGNPIIVQNWLGNNYVNTGPDWDNSSTPVFLVSGNFVHVRSTGLHADLGYIELKTAPTSTNRQTQTGSDGLRATGDDVIFTGIFVHDVDGGILSQTGASRTQAIDCFVYNTGMDEDALSQSNYSAYWQGESGQMKYITRGYHFNSGVGYKIHMYSESGNLDGLTVDGLYQSGGGAGNLLGGPGATPEVNDVHITDTRTWREVTWQFGLNFSGANANGSLVCTGNKWHFLSDEDTGISSHVWKILETWDSITFTNNEISCHVTSNHNRDGLVNIHTAAPLSATFNNNTYYMHDHAQLCQIGEPTKSNLAGYQSFIGSDTTGTTIDSGFPPDSVELVQSDCDWIYCLVTNYSGATSVDVDVTGFLSNDDTYTIKSAQNPLAAELDSGTVAGLEITLDLTAYSMATPVAWRTPPDMDPIEKRLYLIVPGDVAEPPAASASQGNWG